MWDIAFSRDPQQKCMYLADGKHERVFVMNRESLEILVPFGDGGIEPGQFFAVHSIATDTKGNIFTTGTYEGRRRQRFVYRGVQPVGKVDQGVVWLGGSEGGRGWGNRGRWSCSGTTTIAPGTLVLLHSAVLILCFLDVEP